jgi:glycosyltransferase involved in cell wall biosynthesis
MSMGLPVVGWAAGNLPSLADDRVEGRIVPEGDVDGLAKALLELVDDPELRRRMGDAARKRALQRPSWSESAAAWFGAIKEVVSSSPRTRSQTPRPER